MLEMPQAWMPREKWDALVRGEEFTRFLKREGRVENTARNVE